MIVVEPLLLLLGEQSHVNGARVDGAKGECFEAEELAVRCLLLVNSHEEIFDAHSKLTLDVNTRFVGHRHSRLEGHKTTGAHILANLMRTFVHAES